MLDIARDMLTVRAYIARHGRNAVRVELNRREPYEFSIRNTPSVQSS
jgi:hypothetical protein